MNESNVHALSSGTLPGIDDNRPEPRTPTGWTSAAMAITLIAVAVLGVLGLSTWGGLRDIPQARTQLAETQGEVGRLDELLTMAARMYAATADPAWKARYFDHVGLLDVEIARARDLSIRLLGEDLGFATDDANRQLVAIENRSFDLVAHDRRAEALELLNADEYAQLKQEYAAGMAALWRALEGSAERRLSLLQTLLTGLVAAGAVGLVIAMLGWRTLQRQLWFAEARSAGPAIRLGRPWGIGIWACAALIICLGLTGVAVNATRLRIEGDAQTRFRNLANRLLDESEKRVHHAVHALNGFRGLYAASESVTRSEFRRFLTEQQLTSQYRGVLGIGFIRVVRRDELGALIAAERADGAPEFEIRAADGDNELFVVSLIEPLPTNHELWGRDLRTEIAVRGAIERAIESGMPALSGSIVVERDGVRKRVFLHLMPVHQYDENAKPMFAGLVFATIGIDEVFAGLPASAGNMVDLEVFDGRQLTPERRMLYLRGTDADQPGVIATSDRAAPAFSTVRRIEIGGREWSIALASSPLFEKSIDYTTLRALELGGVLLSLLLAALVWTQATGRYRALALARVMTADLATAKSQAERVLLEAETLRRTVDEQSIVSVTDNKGVIIEANDRFCEISGYTRDEVIGRDHRIVNSGFHPKSFWTNVWRMVASGQTWRGEICNRSKNGSLYWVDSIIAPFADPDGTISKFVSIRTDITERKRADEELRAAARTDRLTGLPNRALFIDRLQQALHRAQTEVDYHFAVLFLDFDRFKIINDSLGHEMGDLLLRKIAERLTTTLHANSSLRREARGNTAARLGGDEFVLLLDPLSAPQEEIEMAQRLLEVLSKPYRLGDRDVYSTASIGIVTSEIETTSADEVVRNADIAMYEAKSAGKACYAVFDASMLERVHSRHQVENDLRAAVESGEIRVAYQPIVHLESGRVVSFEALARWDHPRLGAIPPTEFIQVAEEIGLIVPLGRLVMEQAGVLLSRLRQIPGNEQLCMNVNVSRRQLADAGFVSELRSLLRTLSIPPANLRLEITESAVIAAPESIETSLNAVKDLGVHLHLDDFGTGLSSLSLLRRLPLDGIKIDRSFIDSADGDLESVAILHAIISLGHNLGMAVTAEGISEQSQVATVLALECDLVQGFLFGHPSPASEAESMLQKDLRVALQTASAVGSWRI